MDEEYKAKLKQLINERNELRKYIIDIWELLDINSNQSVLGANCVEFYAVLSSVARDRIKEYKEQLKRKEQECKEINLTNERLIAKKYSLNEEILRLKEQLNDIQDNCPYFADCSYRQCDKDRIYRYKQALDEIEYQTKELFLGVENRDRLYCEKILGIIQEARNN